MEILASSRRVIVPPYWGVPCESHQFPIAVVVVAVVVVGCLVVVGVDVVFAVDVVDVVVVGVPQDASSIAASNKKLKPNQINFLFKFTYKPIFAAMAIISALLR